jgi:2-polyprenyl-6-methoxyphenol hydroxylase-like FAD-dependent oxidoreductase
LSSKRNGVRVSVFEPASEIHEVGAGVIVAGPPLRSLDFLGAGDRIRNKAGKRPPGYFHMKHCSACTGITARWSTRSLGRSRKRTSSDGAVLGGCFAAAADVPEAFARYEGTRKNRANAVQLVSRQNAEV